MEHVDGLWYVELQPSVWKVVDCTYFCPHCEASLDPHTLSSHLNGGNHRRKMSWLQDDLRGGATPTCFPCHGGGGIAPAPGRAGGDAPAGEPPVQSWQQVDEDGNRRCLACNKWCDGVHEQTQEHKRRVANYVDGGALHNHGGCPAPAQPWLVWAQGEAWGDERSLKCLLCDKWVQDFGDADTTGYRGHHGELGAGNQKDHRKKMENLECYKRDTVYWSQLLAERERWHPSQAASPSSPPSVPAGWATVWSEEHLAFYYYDEATLAAQWDPPPLPAVAAPPPQPEVLEFEC